MVCSWNSAGSIEACLRSLRENGVGEIILVDADSDDGTREIAAPLADVILTDQRQGLAAARNLGIAAARGEYILNCGADNALPPGSLHGMLSFMLEGGWAGVSAITVLSGPGWLSWCLDLYKRLRFFPGERSVIGTPTLFLAERLKAQPFNNAHTWSDDSELCERWCRLFGARFAIAPVEVREVGPATLAGVVYRWKNYGRSDHEIYSAHRHSWTRRRKLQSWLYPLRVELLQPLVKAPWTKRFRLLPFLLLITGIRYRWWFYHHRHTAPVAATHSARGAT